MLIFVQRVFVKHVTLPWNNGHEQKLVIVITTTTMIIKIKITCNALFEEFPQTIIVCVVFYLFRVTQFVTVVTCFPGWSSLFKNREIPVNFDYYYTVLGIDK